jgi:hypothetical protein
MIDAAAAAMSCEELRDGGGCTDVQKKNARGLIGESLDWWIGWSYLLVSL